MSEQREPARWMEGGELASDVRRELSAIASEAPSMERRARMFAGLEHELGLSSELAELSSELASEAALTTHAARAATASKLKLLFASLAMLAGAVGLFVLWPERAPVRATQQKAQATQARLHIAPLIVMPMAAEQELTPVFDAAQQELVAPPEERASVHPKRERRTAPARSTVARPVAPPTPAVDVASALAFATDESGRADTRTDPVAELALLAYARRALLTRPAHALEFTERHARDYPQGTFAEEREVLAIEALVRLRLGDEAGARTAAFEQRFPNSPQRTHLARTMQTLSP